MMDVGLMLVLIALMFAFEVCDSAFGQGYGTLGSPSLILIGLDPKVVVPSILISQAIGGIVASFCHHKFKNADFGHFQTDDLKRAYIIIISGIAGVMIASFIGVRLDKSVMTTYIGLVVLIMGILILSGISLKYAWKKLFVIGAISAFNKGLSGGGYGPLVAGGQTVIQVRSKNAVAITDLAEAPICLTGFIVWCLLQGGLPPLGIMLPMCLGASVAPFFGTWITYKLPANIFKRTLGVIILLLGILCLLRVLNP